eukprot:GHVU01011062.1.p1 GENE.GHVU01011062.1~~GHVU01011062.1.p1  ORF type:complete len:137 (-),score=14.18 GHVU01011062.1:519-929(-)
MRSLSPSERDAEGDFYEWLDQYKLSRKIRNFARDFSDGLLMSEIAAADFPRLVQLHNYSDAYSAKTKLYNWNTLNTRVFVRLGFNIGHDDLARVVALEPGAVESILNKYRHSVPEKLRVGNRRRCQRNSRDSSLSH